MRTYVVSEVRKKLCALLVVDTVENLQHRVADAPHVVSENPTHALVPAAAHRLRQCWMKCASDSSGVLKSSPTRDAPHRAYSMTGGAGDGDGGDGGGGRVPDGGDGDGGDGGGGEGAAGHGKLVNTGCRL